MRWLLAGVVALCLGGLIQAQDEKQSEGKSRAEQMKAIRDEFQQKNMEVQRTLTQLRNRLAGKALELAKADPKDDVAFEALMYVVQNAGFNSGPRNEAVQLMLEHHAANPKIEPVITTLARQGRGYNTALLEALLEKNPSRNVKGLAAFTLAQAAKAEIENPKTAMKDIPGKQKDAIAKFENVSKEYGDVELRVPRGKIADLASKEIESINKSPLGKTTPEIEGEDIEGAKFKLSDYRGKVVMLDFWGHW
jgi:hypothetical protein